MEEPEPMLWRRDVKEVGEHTQFLRSKDQKIKDDPPKSHAPNFFTDTSCRTNQHLGK
jgi:hypothetical protein